MSDERMWTAKAAGRHLILFVVVLAILSALAIWFGLGAVAHSAATN